MSLMIIFAIGYLGGGISALLVIGLALAGGKDRHERPTIDLVSRDVEQYGV